MDINLYVCINHSFSYYVITEICAKQKDDASLGNRVCVGFRMLPAQTIFEDIP